MFPLAARRQGIVPLWASEIEKAPISITKRHFPDMAHLGDITQLHGGEVPPVDIITFGSPCQNYPEFQDNQSFSRVGQLVGRPKTPKLNLTKKLQKIEKTRRNHTVSAG